MRLRIVLVPFVAVLLACNFLFPTQTAPTQAIPPAAETAPQAMDNSSAELVGYSEVRLHPADGDLKSLLAKEAEKAAALEQLPVVEFDATWCPPCVAINKYLKEKNELMLQAYDGVYLIKLDVDEWGWNVGGFDFAAIPVYFKLDSEGKPTGESIDGGAWNEDIPQNIAPVMDKFFHSS